MTARQQTPPRTPERIDAFVRAFFGEGNAVWPDLAPTSKAGRNLVPYLQVLRDNSDVPVVLPRRRPTQDDRLTAYVIAMDPAHATAVAELLTAFIGPSYSHFDGRPARLDPHDPVDRAVVEFAGPGTTFTLWSPLPQHQAAVWSALRLMQQTVAKRPARAWHVPKPVGRLLAEFEVALAAGEHSASARVLEHLTASGGLTGPNLAHLRIKRLARLGYDSELLRLPHLVDVVAADPPTPVIDAVLTAIYTSALAEPLARDDIPAARTSLIDCGRVVPALLRSDLSGLGAQALTVLALAAWIREDAPALHRIWNRPSARVQIESLAPVIVSTLVPGRPAPPAEAAPTAPTTPGEQPDRTDTSPPEPAPSSWPDLVTAVAHNRQDVGAVLANETWREWPLPAAADDTIAAILHGLEDEAAERVWSVVGAFVDADGYAHPAARSAHELIHIALIHNRFSPGDLAGVVALTEIVLRAAPNRNDYATLLDDLRADSDRWVGPERATVVLDLADLLVRTANPDREARLRLAVALLAPLHTHVSRLDPDQATFARQLSQELETGLDWPQQPEGAEPADVLAGVLPQTVLLYSLDEGALARTAGVLRRLVPGATIHLSHDHVGSPQLRQRARNADVIVLATRCATHATTGFIRVNARTHAVVTEADGSGSASLLRAAIAGLRTRSTP